MFNNMLRYERLGKTKKQYMQEKLMTEIRNIQCQYTKKQIKHWWRKDSLSSDMQDVFMSYYSDWDEKDIWYKAGQIVLFCNHVFNNHTMDKWMLYQIMKDMHIKFDIFMYIDFLRAKRRSKIYKYNSVDRLGTFVDGYDIDNNLEVKIQENLWYLWYKHNKEIVVSVIGFISLVLGFKLLQNKKEC